MTEYGRCPAFGYECEYVSMVEAQAAEIERLRVEARAQYDRGYYDGCTHPIVRHDALKIARERITEWCDAVAVEWGQGSQTHNVARDGRDIVLAALRQPQTDALKIAREALEAAPLIGATESAESFKARQDAWLNGQYRAALDQSK
jgi:hypothetical protein